MSLIIKKCDIHDLDKIEYAINVIKAEEDECSTDKKIIARFLEDNSAMLYIAMLDEMVVAYAILYIQRRLDSEKDMICLYEIGTLRAYRKQKIAKAIINQVIEDCKAMNVMKMYIPTNISNTAACALYKSIGAKESQIKDDIFFTYRF